MINDLVDNIKLDLNRARIDVVKYVRIGDTRVHTLHFMLLESGKVYQLDGLILAEVMIRKPDGNECDQTAIRKGNEIHYTLRTQDYNVLGEARCWLKLTFEDGTLITSPEFSIMVCEDGIPRVREQSTNEYTALTQMLAQATLSAEAAANSASEASAYVQQASDEVQQARVYAEASADSAEEAGRYQASVHEDATAAEVSASNAEQAAQSAEAAAASAESNATAAAGSATGAADSASSANLSATSAAGSATAADSSASSAASAASSAESSASSALASAGDAAGSATAAAGSATSASGSATTASAQALVSEGWAKGTQNGTPVGSESPYYHNNAEYFKDVAAAASGHTIEDGTGTEMPERAAIQFKGDGVSVTDDPTNGRTVVEIGASGHTIEDGTGTEMTNRGALQFKGNGVSVTDDGTNERTVVDVPGVVVLSYGTSTWADFLAAYSKGAVVGCRVSENASHPETGDQNRIATILDVNDTSNPTNVRFIFYASSTTHSDNAQGDTVYVYKLTSAGAWSVQSRKTYTKIVAGTNMTSSYSSNALTLNVDLSSIESRLSALESIIGFPYDPSASNE